MPNMLNIDRYNPHKHNKFEELKRVLRQKRLRTAVSDTSLSQLEV